MGFPRQEYWSGLPFPSPGDLSDPGIEPWALALQADSLPFSLLVANSPSWLEMSFMLFSVLDEFSIEFQVFSLSA